MGGRYSLHSLMNQRFMMVYAMMLAVKAAFAWTGKRFDGRLALK